LGETAGARPERKAEGARAFGRHIKRMGDQKWVRAMQLAP
jgi:hypothetical protein